MRVRQRFASNLKIHAICYNLQFSYVAGTALEVFYISYILFLNLTR